MRKALIILLLLVTGSGLFGQETIELTIDRALELAKENNIQYLISKEGVRQYKHRLRQNLGFLPQITIDGSRNLDEKLMVIEMPPMFPGGESQEFSLDFTREYEFTLQIVQPVFTGGKIWHAYQNARLDLKISKEQERNAQEELKLNVKKIFNNVLVLRELLKAHQEGLELASRNYNNVKQQYELGMTSKYDLLRAEQSVSAVKPNILNVQQLLEMTLENLKVMIGISGATNVEVKGKLQYDAHQLDLSRFIEASLVNRSEIKQLEMESRKVANLLKIMYAQFLPDISIIARYSYQSDLFKLKSDNWNDFYTINLGISFPIFTGLKRSGQVGEMKVMKKIMELRARELNDATRLQVRNLYLTIGKEYENIQTGEKSVETAREGVRIAELNYQEGIISILELNASYNELTQTRVAYLQAVYNYNIAIAELEKISGVKINGGIS